jgi:hypothetical protein
MSMAASAPLALAARPLSRATVGANERNLGQAVALGVAVLLLSYLGFWLQWHVFHLGVQPRRIAERVGVASQAGMAYITVPHFIVGLLFMLTAPRNRTRGRSLLLLAWLGGSAALCWGCWHLTAGVTTKWAWFVLFIYFLIHELRDQAFFYITLGGAVTPAERSRFTWLVRGLIAEGILGAAAASSPVSVFGLFGSRPLVSQSLPLAVRVGLALAPALAWVLAGYALLRWYAAEGPGGVAGVVRRHGPLLRAYAVVIAWLLVGLAVGASGFAVIVLHVTGWYVFTCRRLKGRPTTAVAQGWWSWMRSTAPGFRTLHLGLVVVFIALGTTWVYALGAQGWIGYVLSPRAFYLWTIFHITVSFLPR